MNRPFIALSVPNFEGNEKKYVDDAVKQEWVSTGGAYIDQFEKNLATYLNCEKIAACQSGTSAIHLSLVDAGITKDDVVLVPPLTFIAAVNPVKYQYAKPVFIDCDDSFCLNPTKLEMFCKEECDFINNQLTYKGKPVKAIIVVHVFGNLADMESIMKIADYYNLKVIEDATEALGSKFTEGLYKEKFAGTIGDYGTFSFNGNKIITTGGGGAVTAKDANNVDHIKYLSTQAKDDVHYYIHNEIGYNYRMTNLQAALGLAQLEELPEFIRRKHENYDLYSELFINNRYAKLLPFREGTYSNQWFYSLEINRKLISATMKKIIDELEQKGVGTRSIWGLINNQKPYVNETAYKIERAVYYADRILNIPCSTNLTKEDIMTVYQTICRVLEEMSNE